MHPRNAKLSLVGCCAFSLAAFVCLSVAHGAADAPPRPSSPFSPSNARTLDGKLIAESDFFPASRCASCHQDTHAAWSSSLHRNAAREPFYRESADILLRSRGIEFTRHCESCHTPIALFSGALTNRSSDNPQSETHNPQSEIRNPQSEIRNPQLRAPFTKFDDEGVTCSV